MTEEVCGLCNKPREEHSVLEAQQIINHQFTLTGEVVPTDRSPESTRGTREVMVVPAADVMLRQLLVAKGVISDSELANLGALGYRPGGDPPDRDAEGTEGGMRSTPGG